MPLYEYECVSCKYRFEEIRSIRDRDTAECPKCGMFTEKQVSVLGALITDTSFGYTGKVDGRFGKKPIEGRKDFWNRCKEKHLVEIDLKNMD